MGKKRRSKAGKGSSYERDLCRQLSLWWTNGKRDDIFWRSSGSGARAKVRGRRGRNTYGQHGDICAIDPAGDPFIDLLTVEVKRGYSADSIAELLDKPATAVQQAVESFIQQAMESHEQAGSFSWMVILRRDKRVPVVLLPSYFVKAVQKLTSEKWKTAPLFAFLVDLTFRELVEVIKTKKGKKTSKKRVWKERRERHMIYSVTLETFLKLVTPQIVKRLVKLY